MRWIAPGFREVKRRGRKARAVLARTHDDTATSYERVRLSRESGAGYAERHSGGDRLADLERLKARAADIADTEPSPARADAGVEVAASIAR